MGYACPRLFRQHLQRSNLDYLCSSNLVDCRLLQCVDKRCCWTQCNFPGVVSTSFPLVCTHLYPNINFYPSYIPASILASFLYDSVGLRKGFCVGAFLNALSGWIRFFSADRGTGGSYNGAFGVLMFGQFFGAVAQPFITNLPARFGAVWFPVEQRDIATTIFTASNIVGIALGSILPTTFADDEAETIDMWPLLLFEAFLVTASSSLTFAFFREEPPTPPSKSQELRRNSKAEGLTDSPADSMKQVWTDGEWKKIGSICCFQ